MTNADGERDTTTATLTVDEATERPVEDETSGGNGTTEDGETPAETASDGQPGFGVLATVVALLVGILLGRRR